MVTFKFSTDDIPEYSESFTDFELSFPESQDDNVSEMANKFKKFLLAIGYQKESIDEYVKTDDDIEDAIEEKTDEIFDECFDEWLKDNSVKIPESVAVGLDNDLEELPVVEEEEKDNRFLVPIILHVMENEKEKEYKTETIFNPDLNTAIHLYFKKI